MSLGTMAGGCSQSGDGVVVARGRAHSVRKTKREKEKENVLARDVLARSKRRQVATSPIRVSNPKSAHMATNAAYRLRPCTFDAIQSGATLAAAPVASLRGWLASELWHVKVQALEPAAGKAQIQFSNSKDKVS
jgi:ribosomal protein L28